MKKSCINKTKLYLLTGVLTAVMGCKQSQPAAHQHQAAIQPIADTNVGHLIQPVNEQVVSGIQVLVPTRSQKVFTVKVQGVVSYDTRETISLASRVSGRIEKIYVKYNYQPVKKGQLVLSIYSPDLVAAQRELILVARSNSDASLVQSAKQRLHLLGLSETLLEQVVKTGNPVYGIPVYANASGYILEQSASSNAPIAIREGQYVTAGQTLFTIYTNASLAADFSFSPSLAASLQKGKQLLYYPSSAPNTTYLGNIGLVKPVFVSGQNFTQARVYHVPKELKIGQQLTAEMAISSGKHYWLPQEAMLDLGSHQRVLFRKEGAVFKPIYVHTGMKIDGQVEVLDEIGSWQIASNAYFMVDSEGFIPHTNNHTP
jgi:hypothetical protein